MNKILPCLLGCVVALFFAGCLTTPVSQGGIQVTNSNVSAIIDAANTVFAQSGYSPGPANYPDSVSFDKPAGAFSNLMWGSYERKQTIRAKVRMTPIPGTNNFRLSAQASTVTSAGEAGFEDSRKISLFSGEFTPLLRQIAAQASGAGN